MPECSVKPRVFCSLGDPKVTRVLKHRSRGQGLCQGIEIDSIHTVQGYDLNYAGVIIGNDIGYDPAAKKILFKRENYHDVKGRENNAARGIVYTDDDVLHWVLNIYRVLLTRGIKGTFVYACDPELSKFLKALIS